MSSVLSGVFPLRTAASSVVNRCQICCNVVLLGTTGNENTARGKHCSGCRFLPIRRNELFRDKGLIGCRRRISGRTRFQRTCGH